MGAPSAATPSKVYFTPSPCASTTRVRLLGAGPGSNFDLATFSFQVPTSGLLCARSVQEPTTAKRTSATDRKTSLIGDPPWADSAQFVERASCLEKGLRKMTRVTIGAIAGQVNDFQ